MMRLGFCGYNNGAYSSALSYFLMPGALAVFISGHRRMAHFLAVAALLCSHIYELAKALEETNRRRHVRNK
jgi:hypothetical protein